jgi:glutamine synthetase
MINRLIKYYTADTSRARRKTNGEHAQIPLLDTPNLEVSKIYANLAETIREHNLLTELVQEFKLKFNLSPTIGAELEFYISGEDTGSIVLGLQDKIGYPLKKERGKNQFEINLPPSTDPANYAGQISETRSNIIQITKELGGKADFKPKPYQDDFGSALHIHLDFKEDQDAEKYAQILCHFMPGTLGFFLPTLDDFKRLDKDYMAPTHISYGGNNRTTAVRIPDSMPRRIEHRLAGANADPYMVIYAILYSILQGLENPEQIRQLPKIYGNAFDPQYGMQPISY